jgi:hypothetical protein
MKTVNITEQNSLDQLLREGVVEDVLVVRNGHPIALVVPFDQDDVDWYARERDPAFIESIARAREQVKKGQTLTHGELKAKLGID